MAYLSEQGFAKGLDVMARLSFLTVADIFLPLPMITRHPIWDYDPMIPHPRTHVMTKTLRFLALTSLAALSLSSAAHAQASKDPSTVQAGSYALETSHARVVFAVSHMGFSTWYGDFAGATGTLTLDPKALAEAKLDISIPVATVTTTNAKVDQELKSEKWFDAAKYPTITFRSTKVAVTSPTTAKVTGDLTFHGVTKPTTLDVSFKGAGTNPLTKKVTIGFDATGALKRSDFGQSTYVPMIGDDITLMISAPFEKTAN